MDSFAGAFCRQVRVIIYGYTHCVEGQVMLVALSNSTALDAEQWAGVAMSVPRAQLLQKSLSD